MISYPEFLENKIVAAPETGLNVRREDLHPVLFEFQKDAVWWALKGGRRALFESFGLGKTLQQLEIVRQVTLHFEGQAMIVMPLGVRGEFASMAPLLGISIEYVRNEAEARAAGRIVMTNYERIREGCFSAEYLRGLAAISLDEAAILRGFGGTKTFREFMRVFEGAGTFRFVATATPSPNEYIELLAYAAFLDVMDVAQAKAQPLDAKVLTPTGWKAMGDIQVGDEVIAGDGSATRVIGVYPQGQRQVFRVTFSDGGSTECDAEHLWLTRTQYERNNERRYLQRNPGGTRPYERVRTTAEIAATLRTSRGEYNHSVPVTGPVQLAARDISINPWLLGALLGDACLRDTSVTFSTMDTWMADRVRATLPDGLTLRVTARGSCDYGITSTGVQGGKGPHSNPLLNALRGYGLLGKRSWEKSVPEDYLFNSAEVRIEVLRGLMDTDGTLDPSNGPTLTTTSPQLALDVQMLVRSLGGLARIGKISSPGRDAYRVRVTLPADINPFSLPRKADSFTAKTRGLTRYITNVEPVGIKPAQCIAIEHPSRLYITDDFAVTHNTRFFKRDSTQADKLTLHPHKEREFWLWVSTWALFVTRPSDLGYSDEGYDIPPMDVVWHELPTDHSRAGHTTMHQGRLFREATAGVTEFSREKRESLDARVAKVGEIVRAEMEPPAHNCSRDLDCDVCTDTAWRQLVLWCDLNDEQRAIERALEVEGVSYSSLYGNQDIDERETLLQAWRTRKTTAFVSKPMMYGAGVNLQQSHTMIFAGIGHKFADFIQAVHRIHRFGQRHPCTVHLIYTEAEREVRRQLERKWKQHNEVVAQMTAIVREFGLAQAATRGLARAMQVERREETGRGWTLINNDTVDETARMESDSAGLILTSIPFSSQYEYTPSYRDFGHTDDAAHFWRQMDYLTPELLRVLQPGRIAAIHVKDRIQPGGLTGLGFQTVQPFHADAIAHYTRHGFAYLGMKTIVTDVVRENNQTYRLGWTEQCKDGSRMGCGMPEYLLLFRKPPTDHSDGYADVPVVKDKEAYSRARWQIDAHAFMRSSGNRLLMPKDITGVAHEKVYKLFRRYSSENIYDFEHHVALCEAMEVNGSLPVTFMLMPPASWHPDVWADVVRMRTLNGAQHAKGKEMHLCLARGSRVLTRERGYVPIEDVEIGEHALTHMGRWRPILAKQMTGVRQAITVRAQGVPGLTLTPDHKLWVRKSDWVRERDGAEYVQPDWIEAQSTLGGYVNQKLPPVESPAITDCMHWWIVGRWIADGHWEAHGAAIISCGEHEKDGLIAKLGERAGGTYRTGTAWQIRVLDPTGTLKKTLRACGAGAAGKRLPPEAATLPWDQANALLSGYLSGDGHLLKERSRWLVTAVSRDLLLGVAMLAHRVHGAIASVFSGRGERMAEIEGRTVHCQQEWALSFDLPNTRRKTPFILDDGAWKKVRSIEDVGEVETWNIRVAEDESYTAEGCIVKNCPLQLDIVDRAITQYSMPGELVFDPFSGLGTVPLRAVELGRLGRGHELNSAYWADSLFYLRAAEEKAAAPTLFDLLNTEAEDSAA